MSTKRSLTYEDLLSETAMLKSIFFGREFSDEKGIINKISLLSIEVKNGEVTHLVSYNPIDSENITFTMSLKEFLDRRFGCS